MVFVQDVSVYSIARFYPMRTCAAGVECSICLSVCLLVYLFVHHFWGCSRLEGVFKGSLYT